MQQYQFLFNSCRIPQLPSDRVRVYDQIKYNHVVVLRRNRIFSFDLLVRSEDGNSLVRLTEADICRYARVDRDSLLDYVKIFSRVKTTIAHL